MITKHLLTMAFVLLALLGSQALAEIRIPTYDTYVGEGTVQIAQSENTDTATNQYYTDNASLDSYQALLQDMNFMLNGQWILPGGEGYTTIAIYAYTMLGKDTPELFRMEVNDESVASHILIQAVALEDGPLLVAITRSASIGTYMYVKPTPTPPPTPRPSGSCAYCDNGRCRECGGRGVVRCGICSGSGRCQDCGGKRRFHITNYGVGLSNYVDCQGCHGSGECRQCNGNGKEDCIFCVGGVCPYCHGL